MIYSNDDTICAISTPHGIGGIAVIRVSGPNAICVCDSVWKGKSLENVPSHTAHLGEIVDPEHKDIPVDQSVATVFRAPNSYTGEDTVEFSVHGSRWIQREVINLLVRKGCRLAEAGEFTRRALTNGRIDLAQAEGIADVIASTSRASHRIAMRQMKGSISRRLNSLRESLVEISALLELELDFSEEDVEFADRTRLISLAEEIEAELKRLYATFRDGNAIKEGIPVAIAGATNAGKSSLLNALIQDDRAIVSDIHGTTRDTIEETIEIGDYLFRFIDTAGLRETEDEIEQIGIKRSHDAINRARIILFVIDATETLPSPIPIHPEGNVDTIIVLNKKDLVSEEEMNRLMVQLKDHKVIQVSAKTGEGLDKVNSELIGIMDGVQTDESEIMITNLRQAKALGEAVEATSQLIISLKSDLPTDLVAQELRETLSRLATITGTIPSSEILQTVFSRFCIGK